eukprot:5673101-Pyramimonas_sp.AAC.1
MARIVAGADGLTTVGASIVGLLGGGGIRNGVVGHVVGHVVRIGVVKLGSASSFLSSCLVTGIRLVRIACGRWLSEPVMVPSENNGTVGSL